MDFEAEAVSCTVAVNGQASFFNHLSCGSVNFCDFHAGLDCFYRCGLGLFYDIIDLFVEICNSTYHEASGNVTAIAFIHGAEVDKDGVFFLELSFAGLMMRPGAVGAESNYRLEAVTCS